MGPTPRRVDHAFSEGYMPQQCILEMLLATEGQGTRVN